MRTFSQEFYKTIIRRSFFFTLLLALFLNFSLLFTKVPEGNVPPSFYKKVYSTIQELPEEEKIPYILDHQQNQAQFSPQNIEEVYEQQVFGELSKHAGQIKDYPDYLAKIQSLAAQSQISIFQDTSEYAKKNLSATAEAFSSFERTKLCFVNSMTFADSTDFIPTDILILALLFYLVMSMTIYEKENHLFKLLRCTKKGRTALIISKSMLLVFNALFFSLLFWGSNLLTASLKFGKLDFSASLQSVYGYDGSILPLTIGQYLLLFLFFKTLIYIAISFLMLSIALKTKYTSRIYIYVLLVFLLSFSVYHLIDGNSSLQIFHYLNLIPLIQVGAVFRFYFNLNLFQTPVNIIPLSFAFLLLMLIIFFTFNIFTFSSDKWDSSLLQRKLCFHNVSRIPGTSLFSHECYRLFISEKGVFVFILLFALQSWMYVQKPGIQDINEYYYKNYMEQLQGNVSSDSDAFIQAEKERYDKYDNMLSNAQEQYSKGEISPEELQAVSLLVSQQTIGKEAFDKVLTQYDYAKSEHLPLIYDTGYLKLFGLGEDGCNTDCMSAIIMILFLVFLFSGYYTSKYSSGMIKLIRTLPNGRNRLFRIELLLSLLGTALIYLVCYLPEIWYLQKTFGFSNLLTPVRSISALENNMFHVLPLIGYIALIYCLRLIMAVFTLYVILLLSSWLRNVLLVSSLTSAFLALPLFIHILGIRVFNYCSLNSLFSVNLIFNHWNIYISLLLPFLPIVCILFFHHIIKKIYG